MVGSKQAKHIQNIFSLSVCERGRRSPQCVCVCVVLSPPHSLTSSRTDRQTDRHINNVGAKKEEEETETQTDRQTDRENLGGWISISFCPYAACCGERRGRMMMSLLIYISFIHEKKFFLRVKKYRVCMCVLSSFTRQI